MKISDYKKLQVANVCYANVASMFAFFTNPKYRGSHFTWEKFIQHCHDDANLWMQVANVKGDKEAINTFARKYAVEIATHLVKRATE